MSDEGSGIPVGQTVETHTDNRRWLILAAVVGVLAAFLVGFIPMWLHSRGYETQLHNVRDELQVAKLEALIAGAAIDARLGKYEEARQAASGFYQSLQSLLAGSSVHFTAPQREQLAPLLEQRDEVITLLARGDPASPERLTQVYIATRKAFHPAVVP